MPQRCSATTVAAPTTCCPQQGRRATQEGCRSTRFFAPELGCALMSHKMSRASSTTRLHWRGSRDSRHTPVLPKSVFCDGALTVSGGDYQVALWYWHRYRIAGMTWFGPTYLLQYRQVANHISQNVYRYQECLRVLYFESALCLRVLYGSTNLATGTGGAACGLQLCLKEGL